MSDNLTILAICRKCSRGFVTLPAKLPAFDAWAPKGSRRKHKDDVIPECGGRIELTHEGTKLLSTYTGIAT